MEGELILIEKKDFLNHVVNANDYLKKTIINEV
jgi:hypothetical protein